jgi:hypothetical protein
MRQVPAFDATPLGIVGDGRVARHFLHYLNLLGLPVRTWSRRRPASGPIDAFAGCRTVLVLIRDAAIVPFVNEWPLLREKQVVHFSGNLVTKVAQAAHPLMTFNDGLYDLETYRTIPFVLDSDGPAFHDLLPGLPNPSFTIAEPSTLLPRAVRVGGQLLHASLGEAIRGIPTSPGDSDIRGVLLHDADNRQSRRRSCASPQRAALPWRRCNDRANLKALQGDPFRHVYASFVRAYEGR